MKTWKTTVTIPVLDKTTATAFMEMVWSIIEIAFIPKRAVWMVTSEGNKYTIWAVYKEYLSVPENKRGVIRFV